MENSNWEKGFFKGLLREEDGTPSFARTGCLFLLLAVIAWVTHVVIKMHALPDFSGIGVFLTQGLLSLYGVNKGMTSIKSIVDKFTNGNTTPTP